MDKKKIRMVLEELKNRRECYNMDIIINSSILVSAYGKKQYFEVDYGIRVEGLVLYLISNGCVMATILEKNIESIKVIENE